MSITVPTILSSKSINKDTTVLVNLSNNGTGANRIAVNKAYTLGDLGLDPKGAAQAEPSFPECQARMEAIRRGGGAPATVAAKMKAELEAYQAAVATYKTSGGLPFIDRISAAVVKYLCAHEGFSTSGAGNKPKVTAADLQVTALQTPTGDVIFNVVGSSVWG